MKNAIWNVIITYLANTSLTNKEYSVNFIKKKKKSDITLPEN